MNKEQIVQAYLEYLEKGEMEKVIQLFDKDGIVESPLYGEQLADNFYKKLAADTNASRLKFDGLFFEEGTDRVSLLFDYEWEMKNGKTVCFKVVDIIEFTKKIKIKKLTIIYNTVEAKEIWDNLK